MRTAVIAAAVLILYSLFELYTTIIRRRYKRHYASLLQQIVPSLQLYIPGNYIIMFTFQEEL